MFKRLFLSSLLFLSFLSYSLADVDSVARGMAARALAASGASGGANTVLANPTSGTAPFAPFTMPSCDTATKALQWTTNTGFVCNSSITAASVALSGITGLGTGVSTAAANPVDASGGFLTYSMIGASGTKLCLLDTACTWTGTVTQTFSGDTAGEMYSLYIHNTNTGAGATASMLFRTDVSTDTFRFGVVNDNFDITIPGVAQLLVLDRTGSGFFTNTVRGTKYLTIASAPTASSCGTGSSVDSGSSPSAGKFTIGSGATDCTLTFAVAYPTAAFCTVTPGAQPAAAANIPYISAQSASAFTVSGGTASTAYYYTCGGN